MVEQHCQSIIFQIILIIDSRIFHEVIKAEAKFVEELLKILNSREYFRKIIKCEPNSL